MRISGLSELFKDPFRKESWFVEKKRFLASRNTIHGISHLLPSLVERVKKGAEDLPPIGLHACLECPWINAWAQMLLHLPRFRELVLFVLKPFECVCEFTEQYVRDQKLKKSVSSAKSSLLQMVHGAKMQGTFLPFFQTIFAPMPQFLDSIIFHPEWVVTGDVENILSLAPAEILVEKEKAGSVPRQIFCRKQGFFYDLHSFIEDRNPHCIAYIRVGGTWYQCDDEKVRPISTRVLSVPLCRGVLFFYQKKHCV
jgi:hypothetical protein